MRNNSSRLLARLSAALVMLLLAVLPRAAHADDAPVWTAKPVRIDRTKQNLERLPPLNKIEERRYVLQVPRSPEMPNGGSFYIGDNLYILRNIIVPPSKSLCLGRHNRLWTCGRHAYASLRYLISNKSLDCAKTAIAQKTYLIECRINALDPEALLVTKGLAIAISRRELLDQQFQAKQSRRGLWESDSCLYAGTDCWMDAKVARDRARKALKNRN